ARSQYSKTFGPPVKRDWAMTTRLSRQAGSACRRRCRGQRGRYTHITRFMIQLHNERLSRFAAAQADDVYLNTAVSVGRDKRRDAQAHGGERGHAQGRRRPQEEANAAAQLGGEL